MARIDWADQNSGDKDSQSGDQEDGAQRGFEICHGVKDSIRHHEERLAGDQDGGTHRDQIEFVFDLFAVEFQFVDVGEGIHKPVNF